MKRIYAKEPQGILSLGARAVAPHLLGGRYIGAAEVAAQLYPVGTERARREARQEVFQDCHEVITWMLNLAHGALSREDVESADYQLYEDHWKRHPEVLAGGRPDALEGLKKSISAHPRPIEQRLPDDACVHHWMIDPPNGAISEGVCRKCGERKDFVNYVERSRWPSG